MMFFKMFFCLLIFTCTIGSCNDFCTDAPPDEFLPDCLQSFVSYEIDETCTFKNLDEDVISFTVIEKELERNTYGDSNQPADCPTYIIEDLSCRLEGESGKFISMRTHQLGLLSIGVSLFYKNVGARWFIEDCELKNPVEIDTLELANQQIFNVFREGGDFDTFNNIYLDQISKKLVGFTLDSLEWVLVE